MEYNQSRSSEAERHQTAKSNHYAQERARQMKEHAKKYSVCPSSSSGTGPKNPEWEKEKQEICKNYTIAPATTKVHNQVIGKNNIKDIGK